jgi:putative acetyltransferase
VFKLMLGERSATESAQAHPAVEIAMHIVEGGLDDPRVVELLQIHLIRAQAETARGSAHALDLSGLRAPEVTFWSAWEGDAVVGVGALKRLSADHGEVKSMHTAEAARGRGVGSVMLRHIMAAARARGMSRLSLETGSWAYFAPARALYARHGFVECAPFGEYREDPNSVFMTVGLGAE